MYLETIETLANPEAKERLATPVATPEAVIIRGVTTSGRTFRPSDWAARLAGIMSTFDKDSRLGYSPCVRPALINGIKSVVVDQHLRETDGQAYNNFLLGFARENDLVTEDGDTSSI